MYITREEYRQWLSEKEKLRRAKELAVIIESKLFGICQPDKGHIFGVVDDELLELKNL